MPKASIVPTETDKAYAAGIMDGEGCFYVSRRHERTNKNQNVHRGWYVAEVGVSTTTPQMVEWLLARWGGSIYKLTKRRNPLWGNEKPAVQWRLSAKALEPFLADVQPYLVVKAAQCQLLREMRALPDRRGNYTDAQRQALHDLHEEFYQRASALKRTA